MNIFHEYRSCLRGDGDNNEYYAVLGVDKNSKEDDIKKAYKKTSLSLHPDKLAQRGIEVTSAKKQEFLKVKEAYGKKHAFSNYFSFSIDWFLDFNSYHPLIITSTFFSLLTIMIIISDVLSDPKRRSLYDDIGEIISHYFIMVFILLYYVSILHYITS